MNDSCRNANIMNYDNGCFNCGKEGHLAKHCWAPTKGTARKASAADPPRPAKKQKKNESSAAEEDKKPKRAPVGTVERVDQDIEETMGKISTNDRERETIAKQRSSV
ncbi:hypothetical protein DL771_005644 [Monosporascus sp. 5C6A]|nr:hypothetical protein DL771_005644 [Monosporascus sp. 5C6A]